MCVIGNHFHVEISVNFWVSKIMLSTDKNVLSQCCPQIRFSWKVRELLLRGETLVENVHTSSRVPPSLYTYIRNDFFLEEQMVDVHRFTSSYPQQSNSEQNALLPKTGLFFG